MAAWRSAGEVVRAASAGGGRVPVDTAEWSEVVAAIAGAEVVTVDARGSAPGAVFGASTAPVDALVGAALPVADFAAPAAARSTSSSAIAPSAPDAVTAARSIPSSCARRRAAGVARRRPVTERVLFAAVLLTAIARALRDVPELNGFWVDGGFRPAAAIHLGVGIALRGGGLVAPAIHDAGERSVDDMMRALSDLVQRARGGSLRSSELTDATVTVTNLGDQGVETVYGVIYPPQVALVGLGKVVQRPWAEDGAVSVRPLIHATLSGDHRASVGHRGALFLAALDRILQSPEDLR